MRSPDTNAGLLVRERRPTRARPGQSARFPRRQVLPHHQASRPRLRHQVERSAYPTRYAPVVVGSAALLLAGLLSLPLGWGANTSARAVLTLFCSLAGVAALLMAGLRAHAPRVWRRRASRHKSSFLSLGLILAVITLLVVAGGGRLTFGKSLAKSYWSDVISFSYVNARLVLDKQNPYLSDPAFFPALRRFPYAIETPLREGAFGQGFDYPTMSKLIAVERAFLASPASRHGEFDPATLHSYPALSFLLYVPLIWAGIDNVLVLNVATFAGLYAWQVWLAPQGERHWGALAAASAAGLALFSLFLDNEVVCLGFLLLAWHFRRRRWLGAILLGLACAFKQYCWFFAPFFLLDALLEGATPTASVAAPALTGARLHALRLLGAVKRLNWRAALPFALVALAAFLAPNLPYLVASPDAWWASVWLPQSAPLFPIGIGIIALFTGHLLPYIAPRYFSLLEGLAMLGALIAAIRWRALLGDGVLLLALVPLLFAFRSLPNYFGIAPWIALYAANMAYRARLGAG
ncbi:MAG TPA: hypothetical protein VF725_15215, partial [Ktedonobacterales bacterium]